MKIIKFLLLLIVLFSVGCTKKGFDDNSGQAIKDSNETIEKNEELEYEKINVYLFWGDGCSACARTKTFFETMDEDYKKYYNLIKYEVWKNKENRDLMSSVGKLLNESPSAVPYLVIGNISITGYNNSKDNYIKQIIKEQYEISPDKRIDLVKQVEETQ